MDQLWSAQNFADRVGNEMNIVSLHEYFVSAMIKSQSPTVSPWVPSVLERDSSHCTALFRAVEITSFQEAVVEYYVVNRIGC